MKILIIAIVLVVISAGILVAQSVLADKRRLAVKGYDVVAYWTQGKPVAGDSSISTEYGGKTYYFASEEHRELFLSDPGHYIPQYGGYCGFAMSFGDLAPIKPQLWVIQDDRLFLNFSPGTHRQFLADMEGMIERADGHWPEVKANLKSDG